MIRNTLIILLTLAFFLTNAQQAISHNAFDQLLQKYVDEEGLVNYKGLKEDRNKLKSYLSHLESNAPQESWSVYEQLAYWINAYNAYTLDLILEHYPLQSINEIGSKIKIPFVNTAWDIKFITIGGEEYDLNNIEHGIIRKNFDEPRIHFALVCAAMSCPKLQNRAYLPATLDDQLTAASKEFLADPAKNTFKNSKSAKLSKIFNWYGGDFNNNGTMIEYINQYAPLRLENNAEIDWMDYDWALNEQ